MYSFFWILKLAFYCDIILVLDVVVYVGIDDLCVDINAQVDVVNESHVHVDVDLDVDFVVDVDVCFLLYSVLLMAMLLLFFVLML